MNLLYLPDGDSVPKLTDVDRWVQTGCGRTTAQTDSL